MSYNTQGSKWSQVEKMNQEEFIEKPLPVVLLWHIKVHKMGRMVSNNKCKIF